MAFGSAVLERCGLTLGENMLKLPGEEEIGKLNERNYFLLIFPKGERKLLLTTHRVRYQRKESGSGALKSIMLEDVAACMTTHTSKPLLLLLALVCCLSGLLVTPFSRQNDQPAIFICVGFVLGLVFLVGCLLSRRRILRIGSAGGTINFVIHGRLGMPEVRQFIDDLEAAKNDRYLSPRGVVATTAGKPSWMR